MARKNPDKAKDAFKRLSAEILKYGEEGKRDLKDLFELHKPEVIFVLEQGPERQARAAQLIGEMRVLSRELAQSKYFRERGEPKGKTKGKVSKKRGRQVTGTHDGFRYVLVQLPDGKWGAKITRQARQIIPETGAPPILDHPALRKPFRDEHDAELAIRRIINTSMMWYVHRGITPKERVRKTKAVSAGIQRRTAGQVAARAREKSEVASEEAERRRREQRAEKRRAEKVEGRRDRRPGAPASAGPGRKLQYIPRGNPSSAFDFKHSESSAVKQAEKSLAKAKEWETLWSESLESGSPDFRAVMKAYDHIENARANFTLAGDSKRAEMADESKRSLRHNIIEMFNLCKRELSRKRNTNPGANPSSSEHDKLAVGHMVKAEAAWAKYCEGCNVTDLLNAYKHLELAREEFQHAGNADGVSEAKTKIKLARAALRKS